ncbi:MAG TPA: HK97 gp10 family phage protein [Kofleriaceae bacterium]|nr:HK97 gp10 family phage protein [Kofleriaceae bacterium]
MEPVVSNTIRVGLDQLPASLDLGERTIRRAISRGALAGAHRGRAVMVRATPTDQGQLRASWKVKAGAEEFDGVGANLAELINDAPHISIVELGARPHAVSREGWEAIYDWVRRHFRSEGGVHVLGGGGRMVARSKDGRRDPRIEAITWGIVRKIKKYGQKPTLFVRNNVDTLREVMAYELQRELQRAIANLTPKGGKP